MSFRARPPVHTPPRTRIVRLAHACCAAVAVLVSAHAVLAVVVVVLAEPHPEMEGPSVFAAYIFMLGIVILLAVETSVSWAVALFAVHSYPRGRPIVVAGLCGIAVWHSLFTLFLSGDPVTPVAYTAAHIAVVALAVAAAALVIAARVRGGRAAGVNPVRG